MKNNKCTYCNKTKNLVFYDNFYICEKCLKKVNINNYKDKANINLICPKNIKKILDETIIGQKRVKEVLSVTIYNHYKRILFNRYIKNKNIEIEKSNILIIGDTGTGKTLFAKTISKILKLPFVIVDATSFTQSGYVGEDVESILTRLLQVSNYNIELTENGIVYIDEFDKLSRKSKNPSVTRDVSGEGVQQALLKLFEDTIVYVSPNIGRKHPEEEMIPINTKNILFIVGGTFEGINNIIKNRINKNNNRIGFSNIIKKSKNKKDKNLLKYINIRDLQQFGIIPEIIGRLPIITFLDKLKLQDYKKILINPKNSLIKQYIELFKLDNINIKITQSFIDIVVNRAVKLGLGARGLKNICEHFFIKISYYYIKKNKKHKVIRLNKRITNKILKNYLNE